MRNEFRSERECSDGVVNVELSKAALGDLTRVVLEQMLTTALLQVGRAR
jgi:hypothetical protein